MRIFTVVFVVAVFGSMALAAGYASTTSVPASGSSSTISTTVATMPTTVSPDTAAVINEIRALRGDIRATALEMQGRMLANRINMLQASEVVFRQTVAANPNNPVDHAIALQLQAQATALNSDIMAYNQELSMIPADQRPFIAQRLNAFDVVYWTPATQSFAQYRLNYQQNVSTAYQPAYANTAWLQDWQTNYSTALNNIGTTQQTFASTRWWTTTASTGNPTVLGSTEVYPNGTAIQPGSAIVLPAGTIIIVPPMPATTGTTGTTNMGATNNMNPDNGGYAAGTGAP